MRRAACTACVSAYSTHALALSSKTTSQQAATLANPAFKAAVCLFHYMVDSTACRHPPFRPFAEMHPSAGVWCKVPRYHHRGTEWFHALGLPILGTPCPDDKTDPAAWCLPDELVDNRPPARTWDLAYQRVCEQINDDKIDGNTSSAIVLLYGQWKP